MHVYLYAETVCFKCNEGFFFFQAAIFGCKSQLVESLRQCLRSLKAIILPGIFLYIQQMFTDKSSFHLFAFCVESAAIIINFH